MEKDGFLCEVTIQQNTGFLQVGYYVNLEGNFWTVNNYSSIHRYSVVLKFQLLCTGWTEFKSWLFRFEQTTKLQSFHLVVRSSHFLSRDFGDPSATLLLKNSSDSWNMTRSRQKTSRNYLALEQWDYNSRSEICCDKCSFKKSKILGRYKKSQLNKDTGQRTPLNSQPYHMKGDSCYLLQGINVFPSCK